MTNGMPAEKPEEMKKCDNTSLFSWRYVVFIRPAFPSNGRSCALRQHVGSRIVASGQ
jgi:hypothetical protein